MLAGALVIGRIVSGMLYNSSFGDLFTYLVVSVIFLGIGIIVGYLPARRDAKLDPMVVLRCE